MALRLSASFPPANNHLERVRHYAHLLASRLFATDAFTGQIDADFVRRLYLGTPLHDLGKVAIPTDILLKPGKLTPGEFEVMKRHTTLGAEKLAAVLAEHPTADFIQVAHAIALNHHERFDGRGYPSGLSGEQIPLAARIVALADVYDALTSARVYKPAMTHAEAAAIIFAESGTHFDPVVVRAFADEQDAFERVCHAAQAAPFAEPHSTARWAFAA